MAKLTLKFLEAKCEALAARCDAQQAQINKLFARLDEQAVRIAAANMPVTNQRALMQRAQQLAKDGTPCYVRSGRIYHARSHEELA